VAQQVLQGVEVEPDAAQPGEGVGVEHGGRCCSGPRSAQARSQAHGAR
jgi:hypothetical protein